MRSDRVAATLLGALSSCLPAAAAGLQDAGARVEVRYPSRGAVVAPDSNFIFGSVGSGAATLEIDGERVTVESNGAFLAWLPVPRATRGDTAVYRVVVVDGADTVTTAYPIRRPPTGPPSGARSPWVAPLRRELWYRPGASTSIVVTGEAGTAVAIEAGNARFPLTDLGPVRGRLQRYGASVDVERLHRAACAAGRCRAGRAAVGSGPGEPRDVSVDTVSATFVARSGDRETRTSATFILARLPDPTPRIRLAEAPDEVNGQSGVVVGRPTPFGPYRWRFAEGAVASVSGRVGNRVGLDLGGGQVAWVDAGDIERAPDDPLRRETTAYAGRFEDAGRTVDFRLGLSAPEPAHVTVTGPRALRLTVFGTYGEMSRMAHGTGTGVARVEWTQSPGPRLDIDIELEWPVWGYRLTYETGDPREYEGPAASDPAIPRSGEDAVLRLALRRPPDIDPAAPLSGIRVAVDPGHPGAGSYGPTGYFEGDANLAIARRLIPMLEAAGALPVMIRDDRSALGLYDRTRLARAGDADLLISIHNNALPDGVRPADRAGTSTFYYHPHSAELAAAVQRGLVAELRLPDRGVLWGDLAMVREPWMPAVLAEGAFMMIPAHEAALRTPEFQERYARGIFDGIRTFLAGHDDTTESR